MQLQNRERGCPAWFVPSEHKFHSFYLFHEHQLTDLQRVEDRTVKLADVEFHGWRAAEPGAKNSIKNFFRFFRSLVTHLHESSPLLRSSVAFMIELSTRTCNLLISSAAERQNNSCKRLNISVELASKRTRKCFLSAHDNSVPQAHAGVAPEQKLQRCGRATAMCSQVLELNIQPFSSKTTSFRLAPICWNAEGVGFTALRINESSFPTFCHLYF